MDAVAPGEEDVHAYFCERRCAYPQHDEVPTNGYFLSFHHPNQQQSPASRPLPACVEATVLAGAAPARSAHPALSERLAPVRRMDLEGDLDRSIRWHDAPHTVAAEYRVAQEAALAALRQQQQHRRPKATNGS
jgi:hypothetical protein